MELSLLFEDNHTGHKDLILRFAGQVYLCDTYYLALDRELMPEQEDAAKIRRVLRRLLEQWLSAVETVSDGSAVFLPYDFSDQYTAWLRCTRSGDRMAVCRGWAEVEGWSITPSKIGPYLSLLQGFRPDGPTLHVSVEELRETLFNLTVLAEARAGV